MDSETVKAEVIKQVRTQYAMDNARQLIEVGTSPLSLSKESTRSHSSSLLSGLNENLRKRVLRKNEHRANRP